METCLNARELARDIQVELQDYVPGAEHNGSVWSHYKFQREEFKKNLVDLSSVFCIDGHWGYPCCNLLQVFVVEDDLELIEHVLKYNRKAVHLINYVQGNKHRATAYQLALILKRHKVLEIFNMHVTKKEQLKNYELLTTYNDDLQIKGNKIFVSYNTIWSYISISALASGTVLKQAFKDNNHFSDDNIVDLEEIMKADVETAIKFLSDLRPEIIEKFINYANLSYPTIDSEESPLCCALRLNENNLAEQMIDSGKIKISNNDRINKYAFYQGSKNSAPVKLLKKICDLDVDCMLNAHLKDYQFGTFFLKERGLITEFSNLFDNVLYFSKNNGEMHSIKHALSGEICVEFREFLGKVTHWKFIRTHGNWLLLDTKAIIDSEKYPLAVNAADCINELSKEPIIIGELSNETKKRCKRKIVRKSKSR